MELRVLQYFLAVAQEESITKAAESLHLSQPTLSRQLKDMEAELGKQLLIRGSRKVTLTEEGVILRQRAEEILALVTKTESEIECSCHAEINGVVSIGAGETAGFGYLASVAKQVQKVHPGIKLDVVSGGKADVCEKLDQGLIDFALIFGRVDANKYNEVLLPVRDHWGVLMRKDAPLAEKETIKPQDLWKEPLLCSAHSLQEGSLALWMQKSIDELNVVGSFNLIYNGSRMVAGGMGYGLTWDGLINVTGDSDLTFRRLDPDITIEMHFVWKKFQVLTKAAQYYLSCLLNAIQSESDPQS